MGGSLAGDAVVIKGAAGRPLLHMNRNIKAPEWGLFAVGGSLARDAVFIKGAAELFFDDGNGEKRGGASAGR